MDDATREKALADLNDGLVPERDARAGDEGVSQRTAEDLFRMRRLVRASGAGNSPKGGVIRRGHIY